MATLDFAALKKSNAIEDVVIRLNVTMKRTGDELRSSCPICGGSDRTLMVNVATQSFRCYSIAKSGSVIDLVAHVKQIPLRDAAAWLAEQSALTVPQTIQKAADKSPTAFDGEAYLAKLDPAHEALKPLGIDPEKLKGLGGYASSGVLAKTLAICLRNLSGDIVAFIGIPTDAALKLPKSLKR